jgi:putative ABC transport system ATP-binding protein
MITLTDLRKQYRRGDEVVEAIRGINLQISNGEFIVIIGPSGGGKSTLLNLLGGIDHPTSGSILYDNYPLEKANEEDSPGSGAIISGLFSSSTTFCLP